MWLWVFLLVVAVGAIWACRPYPKPLGYALVADQWEVIRNEALAVPVSDTPKKRQITDWDANLDSFVAQLGDNDAWIEAWAADGSWENYPLVLDDRVVAGRASELCPNTCRLLASMSGIRMAGFSKVRARGRIEPHTDSGVGLKHGRLGLHLCLSGESLLRVGGRRFAQSPGRTIVFNQEDTHSVENRTDGDRVLLYINFTLP